MEDDKILPVGEPGIEVTALPVLQTPTESKPVEPIIPIVPAYVPPTEPVAPLIVPLPEKVEIKSEVIHGVPSQKQQEWGVIISIVVIVLMVIVGAFYAWGQRIAQNQFPTTTAQ
jgi:hypothetical protein